MTPGLGNRCSIQLSYGRKSDKASFGLDEYNTVRDGLKVADCRGLTAVFPV